MTTLAKLLAQKQQLIERLDENPGPEEREEIERLLEQINAASSRPSFFTSTALPLKVNAVLRAITNAPLIRDRSVVRLSVTPSLG